MLAGGDWLRVGSRALRISCAGCRWRRCRPLGRPRGRQQPAFSAPLAAAARRYAVEVSRCRCW